MLRPPRLRFQAKVLLPVMTIMLVLILVPTWVVNWRMSRALQASSAENVSRAEAVLKSVQALRANALVRRYENFANEPRLMAVVQKADKKTLEALFKELLDEVGGEVVLFIDDQGETVGQVVRHPEFRLDEFVNRATEALDGIGQSQAATIGVGPHAYDAVSIPVRIQNRVAGTLIFGVELGAAVLQDFKQVTRGEVVLLVNGHIAASTLPVSSFLDALGQRYGNNPADVVWTRAQTVRISGQHFMFSIRPLLSDQHDRSAVACLLLSSYEEPLRALRAMQATFLGLQLAGILGGGALIWLLVRRVTQPLRELRDSAEAVGKGDFTRRVEIDSGDECGELAAVFNQMTTNLQTSRTELERTVETLKNTQAQLIQSEKLRAIGTLAGGIAHDFNNILGAILGFSELALDDLPGESRTARNLRQVVKAGLRAKDLVGQILAFSRQNDPKRVPVQLSAIVDEALKLLRATIPSTIKIETVNLAPADTVVADPTQLHQVIMNLGTNASHAMRESGGNLTVTLEHFDCATPLADGPNLSPGAYLRLSVSDTGHGMTPDVLSRIFEPFFTTKPVGEGTGLGLSVVHGIIKNHGGDIAVTSQRGHGTTFCVFLPCAQESTAPHSVADQPVPGQAERILVVDDEEALANLMQQRLARLGYEVVAHCDSLQAWKQFQAAPGSFDVVITDQTMPHLTGDDLARKIMSLRPETPIIVCSGSDSSLARHQAKCPGIRQCVSKPVNFTELSRTIRQALEGPAADSPHPPANEP